MVNFFLYIPFRALVVLLYFASSRGKEEKEMDSTEAQNNDSAEANKIIRLDYNQFLVYQHRMKALTGFVSD